MTSITCATIRSPSSEWRASTAVSAYPCHRRPRGDHRRDAARTQCFGNPDREDRGGASKAARRRRQGRSLRSAGRRPRRPIHRSPARSSCAAIWQERVGPHRRESSAPICRANTAIEARIAALSAIAAYRTAAPGAGPRPGPSDGLTSQPARKATTSASLSRTGLDSIAIAMRSPSGTIAATMHSPFGGARSRKRSRRCRRSPRFHRRVRRYQE